MSTTIRKIINFLSINYNKSIIDIILYLIFLLSTTSFFFFDKIKSWQTLFSLLVSLVILYRRKRRKLKSKLLPFIFLIVVLYINITKIINIERYNSIVVASPSGLNFLIFLSCLITEDSYFIYKIFDYYLKIFIFMNSFSIYYYINILFDWGAAYEMISLANDDFIFRNYNNLAIFLDPTIYKFGSFYISRLGGMFEEPGMLGTYAGILLVIDIIVFPKRKFTKFMLVTFGILSISLAFAIFLFFILIYYIYYYIIISKSTKKIIILMIIIFSIISITGLVPAEIRNAYEILLFNRLEIKDNRLAGDNRAIYQNIFESYLKRANVVQLAFGNGINSNTDQEAQYASYHKFIYELGFIGFSLLLIYPIYFLIYIPLRSKKIRHYLLLTIVCGLSLYQRPDFFSSQMIMLYIIIYNKNKINKLNTTKYFIKNYNKHQSQSI